MRPLCASRAPCVIVLALVLIMGVRGRSAAHEVPPPEATGARAEWRATGQVGLLVNSGNSDLIAVSGGFYAHRLDRRNKVALEVTGAYARSTLFTVSDVADPVTGRPNGVIDGPSEVVAARRTTAGNLLGRLRYDRFLTEHNLIYATWFAGLDQPAGKEFFTGGDVGYARELYRSTRHRVTLEGGYNILYLQFYVPVDTSTLTHNLRGFFGYWLTVNDLVSFNASVEALVNCNSVTVANIDYGFAEASKVLGNVGLTTRLWKALSFRATFGVRYDNAPAARPSLSVPWAGERVPGAYLPLAQKVDTVTQLALVVDFVSM